MEAPPGSEVVYTREHWALLEEKRRRAASVMRALQQLRATVIVHGSVARGDVKPTSDVDVVVVEPVPPSLVELALERAGFQVVYREIVMATPGNTPKAYFYLDHEGERVVSVPLAPLQPREREFYKWGGELDLEGLLSGRRVPGVSKDLILIIPTERGHIEVEVEGNEALVARTVGVSIETVRERLRVLTRRRRHGRTGVFVKAEVPPGVPVEQVVEDLARRNPYFAERVLG